MAKTPFDFDPVDWLYNEGESNEISLFFHVDGHNSLAKEIDGIPNIITGGILGSFGIPFKVELDKIESSLNICLQGLENSSNADSLAELLITCHKYYHPENIYIKTFNEVEKHLFESNTSIILKKGMISKDPSVQLSFHMLRAYTRSSEGNFESADNIWNQLYPNWLEADNKRKTHLLLHLYMVNVCMNRWKDAFTFMKSLWATAKGTNASERHEYEIWDDWMCCLIVTWFFASHIKDFLNAFKKEAGIYTVFYLSQKKMILLDHMKPTLIPTLVSRQYYEKARKYHPCLPKLGNE